MFLSVLNDDFSENKVADKPTLTCFVSIHTYFLVRQVRQNSLFNFLRKNMFFFTYVCFFRNFHFRFVEIFFTLEVS